MEHSAYSPASIPGRAAGHSRDEHLGRERLDNRRASRIAIYHEATIDDPAEDLARVRDWAIGKLVKFREVFGRRLGGGGKARGCFRCSTR